MDLSKVKIIFTDDGIGEYGVHDGFFNAIASIDGTDYYFQCCTDENDSINWDDCGYNDGICGDVNDALADLVGWDGVLAILKKAYEEYTK